MFFFKCQFLKSNKSIIFKISKFSKKLMKDDIDTFDNLLKHK